jgi:hypothetical protein
MKLEMGKKYITERGDNCKYVEIVDIDINGYYTGYVYRSFGYIPYKKLYDESGVSLCLDPDWNLAREKMEFKDD